MQVTMHILTNGTCVCVCAGVVKRVAALLLAMTGLGFLLFYLGLKYAFPSGL